MHKEGHIFFKNLSDYFVVKLLFSLGMNVYVDVASNNHKIIWIV